QCLAVGDRRLKVCSPGLRAIKQCRPCGDISIRVRAVEPTRLKCFSNRDPKPVEIDVPEWMDLRGNTKSRGADRRKQSFGEHGNSVNRVCRGRFVQVGEFRAKCE